MIEVKNLTKCYGSLKAVDDISFSVDSGEVLGFLGPNGAGKSTTMNIITGYISSTAGTVTIDGYEILDEPKKAKQKIGYLPEIPPLYPDMTVRKYLEFMFELKKVKLPKKEHINEVMRLVGIMDKGDRIIKNLSKGYRQRVGFAKHTVIFSSHVLSEVSATCDRVIVISNGKIAADGKTDELSQSISGKKKLSLIVDSESGDVGAELKKIPGVTKVEKVRGFSNGSVKYSVSYAKDEDIRKDVFNAMVRLDAPILEMQSGDETLEDMFLRLTQNSDDRGGKKK